MFCLVVEMWLIIMGKMIWIENLAFMSLFIMCFEEEKNLQKNKKTQIETMQERMEGRWVWQGKSKQNST